MSQFTKEQYMEIYRYLYLARHTEDKMVEYFHHSAFPELPHSSKGQEAVSVGAVYGLRKEDQISPALRTRGAFLTKGISSRDMMAGAFAKDTKQSRSKQTSHHLGDPDVGVLFTTGVVAANLPVAVGAALAFKMEKKDNIVVAFFGDGASSRGDVHEAMNLAALWDLPIVFICENNGYAISTPLERTTKVKDIATRAAGYGMPGVIVDGNDFFEVYNATEEAYKRARNGEGPTLIECKTYRFEKHSERDPRDVRPLEEIEEWKAKCPVKRFKTFVLDNDVLTSEEVEEIENSVHEEVLDAIKFAEDCPYPPADILLDNVYSK